MPCNRQLLAVSISAIALFVTSNASANLLLTQIYVTWPPSTAPRIFALTTGRGPALTANFTSDGPTLDFGAHDTGAISQLTAELTDGELDTLSFAFSGQSGFLRPESFFATSGLAEPRHFDEIPFPNGIDYAGLRIDSYRAELSRADSVGTQVTLSIYGGVPEPTTLVLAIIGAAATFAIRFGPAASQTAGR